MNQFLKAGILTRVMWDEKSRFSPPKDEEEDEEFSDFDLNLNREEQ